MNRLLTAAIGVPATILLILYSPDFLFAIIVAAAGARCLWEFMALGKSRLGVRPAEWVLLVGSLVTLSFTAGVYAALIAIALAILVTITAIAFASEFSTAFQKGALAIMGIVYCGFLPGFLLLLRREEVLVLLGILWIGDAAAYYGGRRLGRHLLAPAISPKKTIE